MERHISRTLIQHHQTRPPEMGRQSAHYQQDLRTRYAKTTHQLLRNHKQSGNHSCFGKIKASSIIDFEVGESCKSTLVLLMKLSSYCYKYISIADFQKRGSLDFYSVLLRIPHSFGCMCTQVNFLSCKIVLYRSPKTVPWKKNDSTRT